VTRGNSTDSNISNNISLGIPDGIPNGISNLSDETVMLELSQFRRSPTPGASASRPKRCFTTPSGEVYFKFDITNNEICAELFAYHIGNRLGISMAKTRLARYKNGLGIASYDIGGYDEPLDTISYSVKDFLHIKGFVSMCLFDYLIMNEDRHAGNWGIQDDQVKPLYDHNYCFGGPDTIVDAENFMVTVTSPFYVSNEQNQRQDTLLKYFVKYHKPEVDAFISMLSHVDRIDNNLLNVHFPDDCRRLNVILAARIEYMIAKVGEYSGRQIDDNEF
jgi:hypothetical protein